MMEGAVRTTVVVTDKDGGGGGQNEGCGGENTRRQHLQGQKERLSRKRRRRKAEKRERRGQNYQITLLVHTKITVLPMVLYLCLKLCVYLSFLLSIICCEKGFFLKIPTGLVKNIIFSNIVKETNFITHWGSVTLNLQHVCA